MADAVYIVKVEALSDAVTWVPALPASGSYQVYAKWTADETRATDARYSIVHEGGTAEVSVNQRAAGGLWQYLGAYAFDPLNTPTVSLAAKTAAESRRMRCASSAGRAAPTTSPTYTATTSARRK